MKSFLRLFKINFLYGFLAKFYRGKNMLQNANLNLFTYQSTKGHDLKLILEEVTAKHLPFRN